MTNLILWFSGIIFYNRQLSKWHPDLNPNLTFVLWNHLYLSQLSWWHLYCFFWSKSLITPTFLDQNFPNDFAQTSEELNPNVLWTQNSFEQSNFADRNIFRQSNFWCPKTLIDWIFKDLKCLKIFYELWQSNNDSLVVPHEIVRFVVICIILLTGYLAHNLPIKACLLLKCLHGSSSFI